MPAPAKNMALRAAQYRVFSDPGRSLELSRAVVAAKIANQRTLLMRSLRSQAARPDGDAPSVPALGDERATRRRSLTIGTCAAAMSRPPGRWPR